MTNPFQDQKDFMLAGEQTVDHYNAAQTELYLKLVVEEFGEALAATSLDNYLKELADMLVVIIGTMYSIGADADEVWRRVHASNMSKLVDGKLVKREDGKILKPDSYAPADLTDIVLAIPGLEEADLVKLESELEEPLVELAAEVSSDTVA